MNDEPSIPIRPEDKVEIVCMVRGKSTIDLADIKWLHTISTDNGKTTQIFMKSGESYYIRGKDKFEVANEIGIVIVLKAAET